MNLRITVSDLDRLASLPLRSDPRFNTFLAAYARIRSASGGCGSCRKARGGQPAVDAAMAAGAAFKAISAADRAAVKKLLAAHFKVPNVSTVSFELGAFVFQI